MTQPNLQTEQKSHPTTFLDKLLGRVEVFGNKLPDPFILFVCLALIIVVASVAINSMGVTVVHPGTNKTLPIKSLLSHEGIQYILTSMLTNFTEFKPLGLVLAMMLGVGLAEKVGLLEVAIKKTILNAPKALITYAIIFTGIMANLAADAAFVIVPPLAAMIFYTVGRHPLAGLAAGFAGVGSGFTANLIISGTDGLLSGISTEAAKTIDPSTAVSPAANWYFMAASVFVLTVIGAVVTEKIVEPRLGNYKGKKRNDFGEISEAEAKGLKNSIVATCIYVVVLAVFLFWPNSPLRNEDGGIVPSPFLDGIIPITLLFFVVVGSVYGITVGKIKNSRDVPAYMTDSMKDMASYIVLIFAAAQFIAYFNWTNIGTWIAVEGADALKALNLTGLPVVVGFVFSTVVLSLLIFSGSAQWALEAPIFIPLFMLLGYNPGFIQAAYRIADSSTNVITPLNPYMIVILAFMKEYEPKAGLGTIISLMLPYTLAFLGIWIIMLIVFAVFGIPLGPGVYMYL